MEKKERIISDPHQHNISKPKIFTAIQIEQTTLIFLDIVNFFNFYYNKNKNNLNSFGSEFKHQKSNFL